MKSHYSKHTRTSCSGEKREYIQASWEFYSVSTIAEWNVKAQLHFVIRWFNILALPIFQQIKTTSRAVLSREHIVWQYIRSGDIQSLQWLLRKGVVVVVLIMFQSTILFSSNHTTQSFTTRL
ncbi:Protein of unknown function [Pyronema omphalodes CBS 100304]|uniref:Uncharacterized protein n=1 Tax=Pyronema omphalodes (strain CBS 100304) TaxID=1076935 RepID=U4L4H4_PYROM|nr:Protein of unknown function [Pyronema omphalodes CBS 100304]